MSDSWIAIATNNSGKKIMKSPSSSGPLQRPNKIVTAKVVAPSSARSTIAAPASEAVERLKRGRFIDDAVWEGCSWRHGHRRAG
jgi:hypothetical protein